MNRPIIIIYSFICLIIGVNSCSTKSGKADNQGEVIDLDLPNVINLESQLHNIKSVPVSILGRYFEYIPLESREDCLIERIRQIEFSDSYIFIRDVSRVLQFNRDGSFIRQIGSIGRGPGEYLKATSFCLDTIQKKIYIKNYPTPDIMGYGFDGQFLGSSFKFQLGSSKFFALGTNRLIFHLSNMPQMPHLGTYTYSLFVTDTLGILVDSIGRYERRKFRLSISDMPSYVYNNQLRFLEFGNDTLYSVIGDSLEAYTIFDLGKSRIPLDPDFPNSFGAEAEEARNKISSNLWVRNIKEIEDYFFLKLYHGLSDSVSLGLVDKQSLETTFLESIGFENDLDGGLPFWPRYVYKDSLLVDWVESYVLKNYLRNNGYSDLREPPSDKYIRLQDIGRFIKEESNPVLIIVHQ